MNNRLMITILSNVVNQAPKVNQETVDNVKAIIAHLEESHERSENIIQRSTDQIVEATKIMQDMSSNDGLANVGSDIGIPTSIEPKRNKGGRPRKMK